MEYSETQRAAFIKQFSQQRSRSRIASVALILMLVALRVLPYRNSGFLLGLSPPLFCSIGLFAVIGLFITSVINWRCPACGRHLGRTLDPIYCSHCGVQLSE